MSLLRAVVDLLRERRTPFALIGAAAMAVHGVSRSTRDLDLLVVTQECLSSQYWEPVQAEGIDVNIQKGDSEDPLAGVVRLRSRTQQPLDLVVGKSAWQTGVLRRASETTIEGVSIPVVDQADLILLKLYAGGAQDAWDIVQLLSFEERSSIIDEVERRLPDLPEDCRRLWARIRGTTGGNVSV